MKWIKRLAAVLAIAVALVLLTGLVVVWRIDRNYDRARATFEKRFGATDFGRFALAEIADEENAAYWITEASNAVVDPENAGGVSLRGMQGIANVSRRPLAQWTDEDLLRAEEFVAANGEAFVLLERALPCEQSTFHIDYGSGHFASFELVDGVHRALRLLSIDSRLALRDGDLVRFERDLSILRRAGEAIERESFLLASIYALAAERVYLFAIGDAVAAGLDDVEVLTGIEATLATHDLYGMYRADLAADGALAITYPAEYAGRAEPADFFDVVGMKWISRRFLDEILFLTERLGRPYMEIWREWEEESGPAPRWTLGTGTFVQSAEKFYLIEMERQLALRAVRLRKQRLANGAYPPTLEPATDPFSGEPYVWEVRSDGAASLSAPGAQAARKSLGAKERLYAHRYTWQLPAA